MADAAEQLFAGTGEISGWPEANRKPPSVSPRNGVLPSTGIRALIASREVIAVPQIDPDQIQPASLDLRLGKYAYRVRASFLPGPGATVEDKLEKLKLHRIDITDGAVLETGCVYVVPLMEHLRLRTAVLATANPKSSTGRLDVFTRLITDRCTAFDTVPEKYEGQLYAEISPRTFSVLVRMGSRLNQLRFRRGDATVKDSALRELHESERLVDGKATIRDGLALSVDLGGSDDDRIGFRARRHAGVIDVDKPGGYYWADFWESIYCLSNWRHLTLDPHEFYILRSREAVHVPPDYAAEMVPFDPLVGEFRVHYAGFFDPGFGCSPDGGPGSRAVLEVRSHEVPFILEDRQTIGRLIYEKLNDRPTVLYGDDIGSNYQNQGLKLSKHFRDHK